MPETTPPPRPPFAPWDRRQLPGLFSVEESARRVGNYKWVEMRLFEALGGWVATVPEMDVKIRLGTHCYKHAWHADLWHKRLPELREMNPDRLTQPANDAMVQFMEAMTAPEAPGETIEKLVGVYRVLIPHKVAAYTFHLNATSTITDAPTIRWLKFILQDEKTPLGSSAVVSLDPITITVESGGFEDAKRLRHLSRESVEGVIGRHLMRTKDRLNPGFGEPPADDDIPIEQYVAWDIYAVGRLERLGFPSQRERRRYHFRIRHGFTDVADRVFDRLWAGENLMWADLQAASAEAMAAKPAPPGKARAKAAQGRSA